MPSSRTAVGTHPATGIRHGPGRTTGVPAPAEGTALTGAPLRRGALRLFGFHHAGGGTSAFSGWQRELAGRVGVVPVRLPGRDHSGVGSPHSDLTALVQALHTALEPQLEQPHLFYGHSMGALVAYELARLRVDRGYAAPRRLIVGAFPAPHLPPALGHVQQLPDGQLARWLMDLSGLPEELLGDGRRSARQLTLLREDLGMCSRYRHLEARGPLPCPVDVIVGTKDPLVAVADAAQWDQHSARGGTFHTLSGGHFFTREAKAQFFSRLNRLIDLAEHDAVGALPLRPLPPV